MSNLSKSKYTRYSQSAKSFWLQTFKRNHDVRVQNGGDSMNIFPKIQFMTPEEQQTSRTALLHYCCLDTMVMVKVWVRLIEVSKCITI